MLSLRAAAVYNLAWGGAVVVLASSVAWQIVAMMVAVYGVGYWLASRRPNPELVAVGLLGKVLGPIGCAAAIGLGKLPAWYALVVLTSDVVWWPAFVRYLRETARFG
jgi:hypothetical protein